MHPFSSWEKMRGKTSEKETGERYLVGSLLQSSLFMPKRIESVRVSRCVEAHLYQLLRADC